MPFIPLSEGFPRVSRAEQAARDADAEQIVASEFDQEMPDENRAALEAEYQTRFGKEPPAVQRGFVPLGAEDALPQRGFIPLGADDADGPSALQRAAMVAAPYVTPALKTVQAMASGYPVAETAANLITMGAALPVAGIAGIGAAAGKALGLTDAEPADAVHAIGNALTYQPKTELGQHLTRAAMYPFEKLQEAGAVVGDKVLDATGSPAAATVVDTAINALPMAVAPAARAARMVRDRISAAPETRMVEPVATPGMGAVPIETPEMVQRAAIEAPVERIRRAGSVDESIAEAHAALDMELARPEPALPKGEQAVPRAEIAAETTVPEFGTARELPPLSQRALLNIPQPPELRRNVSGNLIIDGAADNMRNLEPALRDTLREEGIPLAKILDHDDGVSLRVPKSADEAVGGAVVDYFNPEQAKTATDGPPAGNAVEAMPATPAPLSVPPASTPTNTPAAGVVESIEPTSAALERAQGMQSGIEPVEPATSSTARPLSVAVTQHGNPVITGDMVSTLEGEIRRALPGTTILRRPASDGSVSLLVSATADPVVVARTVDAIKARVTNESRVPLPAADAAATPIEQQAPIAPPNYETRSGFAPLTDSVPAPTARSIDTALGDSVPRAVEPQIEIQPGRFSARGYTDALLDRLARGASPTIREEIKAEQYRRSVLAERSVAEHQAMQMEAPENNGGRGFVPLEYVQTPIQPRPASADFSIPETAVKTQDMAAEVQNGTWSPGAKYVPFVDDARAPTITATTVADLPDPIRRERILGDLAKGLDTTIYEGRVKGEKRLGFFRPKIEEVRTKRANDIEVAAHEVAHLIDHRIPEIHLAYLKDKVLRDELRSVSYDQKNVKEGFAEAVRLWATQPEALEAKSPKAYAWLEEFANTHKYGPALRKAQEQMTGWFGQDALNRARSKIGSDKPLSEYFDGFWDKFRQSTVDDLHGVYRMEREMTGKVAPNGPYESARLSRASASIADGAVRFGYPVKNPDASFKYAGKGLEEILKPVAESMDDSLLYFVGRSARELLIQNREHLFTKGEVDAMLKLRTPERDQAFREYQDWNKGILDFAEAQGVINPETRRLWKRTQYLPFHRVEQPGGIKGKPGDWSGIQALTGGTTNIKDVLGNMIGNAAMLLDKAVKNEARLKVARLSQLQGGGKYMVKIEPGERMVKIGGDQVMKEMFKRYGIAVDGDAPAFFEFLIKGQPPAGSNVVAALQQGKPVWFEVGDPILYRALTAIDRPVQSEVVRWLGLPKRIGQASITAVPDFWMANMARDTIMGSVMSRAGFRPILDSMDGMRMRMTQDPIYKDWVANGGGLSSIYLDEGKLRTKLEQFYTRQGIDYKTVLDSPSKLLNMIETLGDAFESSTRLGEYKRAVARGENPRHAAYLARDVSTDFAMKGDNKALGFMYDTVMFLRPALVSWDRLYRGLAHDPNKGAIAAKAGTIALMSAGLYLLNKDDPRYADLPDWDRDSNWHFFVGDQHFRYPKIWEIGAMASAAERSVEKTMAEDPVGLGKDFARIIKQTFNLNLMPQIAAPLAEQATNRNSFTKAPIETPGMENVQPFLRSKPGTSETMKAAGMATRDLPEALQVNPARAEALLRGYFNTWALYGLMLSDQAMFGDKLPEKRADELPVVRRFYANEPAKHTKYETAFYDLLQESKRLRGTMRELDEMNLRTYADEKEKSPLATEAKPLERAAKNLGVINKDMEQVRRSDATPAAKREKLDALTIERNALLKSAVNDSQQAQQKEHTP